MIYKLIYFIWNTFPEWLKVFIDGKKHTESFDVGYSYVTITDNNGDNFYISRTGYIWNSALGVYVFTSKELIKSYMSDSKRTILTDDFGKMVPVCNIKSIGVSYHSEMKTASWRA